MSRSTPIIRASLGVFYTKPTLTIWASIPCSNYLGGIKDETGKQSRKTSHEEGKRTCTSPVAEEAVGVRVPKNSESVPIRDVQRRHLYWVHIRQGRVTLMTQCIFCGDFLAPHREEYKTCMPCQTEDEKVNGIKPKFGLVPMHKGHYFPVFNFNKEDLIGINNKGGIVK
jgi:hypothetical protein